MEYICNTYNKQGSEVRHICKVHLMESFSAVVLTKHEENKNIKKMWESMNRNKENGLPLLQSSLCPPHPTSLRALAHASCSRPTLASRCPF